MRKTVTVSLTWDNYAQGGSVRVTQTNGQESVALYETSIDGWTARMRWVKALSIASGALGLEDLPVSDEAF